VLHSFDDAIANRMHVDVGAPGADHEVVRDGRCFGRACEIEHDNVERFAVGSQVGDRFDGRGNAGRRASEAGEAGW